jgi:hypothetical protein
MATVSAKASYNRAQWRRDRPRPRLYSWARRERRIDYKWHGEPHVQAKREDARCLTLDEEAAIGT